MRIIDEQNPIQTLGSLLPESTFIVFDGPECWQGRSQLDVPDR